MRRPSLYGTHNQRLRIYRNAQLPYKNRAIVDIPFSLGTAALAGEPVTRYGIPALLGAVVGHLAGLGAVKGAVVGAAAGYLAPEFGSGLRSEVSGETSSVTDSGGVVAPDGTVVL
jgi:hypothetical protein